MTPPGPCGRRWHYARSPAVTGERPRKSSASCQDREEPYHQKTNQPSRLSAIKSKSSSLRVDLFFILFSFLVNLAAAATPSMGSGPGTSAQGFLPMLLPRITREPRSASGLNNVLYFTDLVHSGEPSTVTGSEEPL
jgi:hypothetical protein